MNISTLPASFEPSALTPSATASANPTPSQGASAASATAASGTSGNLQAPSAQSATPAQPTPSSLQKAVQKINQQLEQSSGVTLSAGLDTSGQHPGQVLVELSDKATKQTFFKYYVPASQVVKASENLGSPTGAQGALISAKA